MTEKSLEEVGNDRLVDVTKVYTICVDMASSHVGDVMCIIVIAEECNKSGTWE